MVASIVTLLSEYTLLPIEMLLKIIVSEYLITSYCVTFISEVKINFQIPISFATIVPNVTPEESLVDLMINVIELGCSDYVIIIREPAIFIEVLEEVHHITNMRRSDKKIVVIPFDDDEDSGKSLLNILALKETSFLANLLIVLPATSNVNGCTTYDLVTHQFGGSSLESYHQPVYLDKWDSCTVKFKNKENLFPHSEISNLFGKVLKVACLPYKPYVVLDVDPSIVPTGHEGVEMRILDEFCRWVNCTLEVMRYDGEQWGQIYENRTGTGILGSVVEDRADFAISALYSWYEMYMHLDFSDMTIRAAAVCLVPAPRLLISWNMPMMPFSYVIWIGMAFTFFFCVIVLIKAQGFSLGKAFLTTLGILVSQSRNDSSITWRRRSITGWLMLAGVILCSAYGAGLASTFTVPRFEKSAETIQDILDLKLEWGATHDVWIFSLRLSQEPKVKQFVELFRVLDAEELKRRSFTRNMAFVFEKLSSGSFAIGDYITMEAAQGLKLMQEDLYDDRIVVMLRKSSPYTKKLSKLIGRLHETGLLLAWEDQVALHFLDSKLQLQVKLSKLKKGPEIVSLSLRHVVGIFYLYFLGIIVSMGLFIIEMKF